ncbi:DeoR family transcriptional regulator [Mucilaginibacter sp. PPCGB 2223]|uniref:DeoR/GlpR family DNA-binding transcription regulator n=1 Tax=Mucilaginibacter sp. PPCGB 2223 TaxID=1886027 RepID=UPI0008245EB7|nr:DeoR/GlpR family DNA-binding transcription regulator [Mucilaginibacter sp. PPCGB 2223]OCX51127.1 DeoR family transcriptional regulator [Mucilaginibacter sp. PPCGB 2223]
MLKKERHSLIIKQVNLHNKVLSADLALQLNVSEDTIRRDLNEMDEAGEIVKVHGGALSRSYHYPFKYSDVYAADAKKKIAHKAISLIKDGMVILTGGGTTMIEMVGMLPKTLSATIFTISPLVALQLADHPLITVILIGGQFSKNSQVCVGPQVTGYLNEIRFDFCFLGTNGISLSDGVTDSDLDIVQVKKSMIRSSNKLAVMCIAEKLNSSQRIRVCELSQISCLITDLDPTDQILQAYSRENIQLY